MNVDVAYTFYSIVAKLPITVKANERVKLAREWCVQEFQYLLTYLSTLSKI
jgi:hypothetical protein